MKWISLCRDWLSENAPCEKLEALRAISEIMPLGVRRDDKVIGRTQLAYEAIRRVYGVRFCDLPLQLQKPAKRRIRKHGVTSTIMELSKRENGITCDELKQMKNGLVTACNLVRRGDLKRNGKVFYFVSS